MDCKEIQDNLSAYMDLELENVEAEGIKVHLGVCTQCRAEHDELLKGWQALDAWDDSAPSDRLRRKILESVRPQRKVRTLQAVLSIAAGLLLVFGVSVYHAGQKGKTAQGLARSQSPVQVVVGDISEDEIIANLLILQEDDFFEKIDELVKIDDLPFAEEPFKGMKEPERSSLDVVLS